MEDHEHSEEEKALKDFLLDIECLDPLAAWTSKFNLFDILRITRTEIRHSNMLSWLLNPNENHGLGDSIIRGVIQYVVTSFGESTDVFSTLLMDCYGFIVQREWHNIDVLAVSAEEKFVLCIENKIDSGEHSNQLGRYRSTVEENYSGYRKMYVFLSPYGVESSEPDYWCPMGYPDILDIITRARQKVNLLPDAELLIDNYVEAIRRDIVGDEELAKICAEIYAKHRRALDLIFENKPDRASDVAEIFRMWISQMAKEGRLIPAFEKCNKTYTRFKTKSMSEILPDAEEAKSGWNTPNHYFYEIVNSGGSEFYIQLALSARNIPDNLRQTCDRINAIFPSRQQKENWLWRVPFTTKRAKVDEEISKERVFEQLSKRFEEILVFEAKLTAHLHGEEPVL